MAEITITQDNIVFGEVKDSPIVAASGKYSNSGNNDGYDKFNIELNGNQISKSINAVEIDWNGAKVPTDIGNGNTSPTSIISTGELIGWILNNLYSIKRGYDQLKLN